MKKTKRITIRDVAKLAGVSISTVSRYLSKSNSVSEELAQKVQKSIEELNYHPNRIARSLRTGTTKMIGFLIPDITNPAFLLIVKGAEDYLRKRGYSFILCGTNHSAREETKHFKALISQGVDGFIITSSENRNEELQEFIEEHDLNIVFVDRKYEEINVPYVGVDNTGGVEKMIDYLVEIGSESFAYLCGEETSSARERFKGFLKGMKRYGIKDYQVLQGSFTFESGYSLVKKLKKIPDAILGGNDLMAFGAIEALKTIGLKIPEDVSVVGFDDMFFSQYYKPSLTTVKQPIYDMGKVAAKILFSLLSGKRIRKKEYILDTEIVVRGSSKPKK